MAPGCWSDPTTKDAYRLSWASLVLTFVAALAGISLYTSVDSSLALVFGLENCIDFLSSAVVLWRFFAPTRLDEATEQRLRGREQRASIAISFILVFLGIGIISTAINDLKRGQGDDYDLAAAIVLSFFSMPVFAILTVLKFRYSKKLSSPSLYKDGICSLIGTVLAVALFFNTLIIESVPEAWWVDPLIALLGGIAAIWIGAFALFIAATRDKIPIFSCQWWMLSKGGDAVDEMAGPNDLTLKEEDAVEMAPDRAKNEKNTGDGDGDVEDIEII